MKTFQDFSSYNGLQWVCTETVFWTLNHLVPIEVHSMGKNNNLRKIYFFSTEERKTWTSWMTWG